MASAASILMSRRLSSAIWLDSSTIASSAYPVAAMNAIFAATASCSPTGLPHCTRSPDHSLAILSATFPAAAQLAGSESLPVFRVVRAIFRPWPSSPILSVAGTLTSWNRVTPFSRPRRPMNALRCSTVTPSELPSTTNAVMPPRRALPPPGPPASPGTRAITTSRSAMTPLVVHSFTPLRTYSLPSADGVAVVASRAGSEPTSGSVSRNALISPRAHLGR